MPDFLKLLFLKSAEGAFAAIWQRCVSTEKGVIIVDFKQLLKNDFIILDGAMGTMLQAAGLEAGGIPELLNITDPE